MLFIRRRPLAETVLSDTAFRKDAFKSAGNCGCICCASTGDLSALEVSLTGIFFRLSARSRSLTTISTVLFSTLICPQPPSSEKHSPSHPPNRRATVFFSFLLLIFPSFFLQKFLVGIRRVISTTYPFTFPLSYHIQHINRYALYKSTFYLLAYLLSLTYITYCK